MTARVAFLDDNLRWTVAPGPETARYAPDLRPPGKLPALRDRINRMHDRIAERQPSSVSRDIFMQGRIGHGTMIAQS